MSTFKPAGRLSSADLQAWRAYWESQGHKTRATRVKRALYESDRPLYDVELALKSRK